jgi:methylthioribose-1-phosphate isomerase
MRRLEDLLDGGIQAGKDTRAIAFDLVKDGQFIADEDIERNRCMGKNGGDWLQRFTNVPASETFNILTVCNTGSLATSVWYLHVKVPEW